VLDEIRAGERSLAHRPLPGGRQLVRALAAAGVQLALVTSASAARAATVTSDLGIADCFKVMVTWGVADRGKPDPQPYLIAAGRLGADPARCVVFEDSVNGVRAAVAAGAACIAVSADGPADRLRMAGAVHVIASLTQVRLTGDAAQAGPGAKPIAVLDADG
jgi:HAD superfamily hydrolase (TIGR01509 family)